jgi:hypothetical protein
MAMVGTGGRGIIEQHHKKYRNKYINKQKQIKNTTLTCMCVCVCVYTGRFIMYSGITKIYYRKTIGHVFMKPVQVEGTQNFFFQ